MSNDSKTITIDLLRHGECEGGECYRGSLDVPLLAKGRQQMQNSLQGTTAQWQRVISSPLVRCADFAKQFSQQQRLPLAIEDDFREMHFGDWEGQAIQTIWDTQRQRVEAWSKNPVKHPPPSGEPADQFSIRVVNAFSKIVEGSNDDQLLLIIHGGVIRILLAHCLGVSLSELYRFDVPYACLSRVQVITDDGQHYYRLLGHNIN